MRLLSQMKGSSGQGTGRSAAGAATMSSVRVAVILGRPWPSLQRQRPVPKRSIPSRILRTQAALKQSASLE